MRRVPKVVDCDAETRWGHGPCHVAARGRLPGLCTLGYLYCCTHSSVLDSMDRFGERVFCVHRAAEFTQASCGLLPSQRHKELGEPWKCTCRC
jgi:hypothetical protein